MATGGNIEIKNIIITYISTKTDKFDNTICYFKVTDTKAKKKLSLILSQLSDECRLPLWKTESNEYMIKVKQKYAPKILIVDTDLTVQLTFKYYCMDKDDKLLQGYYTLIKLMNKSENIESD